MRRRFIFILILLVLVSGVSRREPGVLVHLLSLPVALVLYPLACLLILLCLASPLLFGLGLWLLWRWMHDGRLPLWTVRPVRWLRSRSSSRAGPEEKASEPPTSA